MIKKYKNFAKIVNFIDSVPVKKILLFKKSKWKPIKQFIKRKNNAFFFFLNFNKVFFKKYSWVKVKNTYKQGLNSKKFLNLFFGNALSIRLLKENINDTKKLGLYFLFKQFLRLDILLWKLTIFPSIKSCHQSLFNGLIFVNDKRVTNLIQLKAGDIISLSKINNVSTFTISLKNFLFSFCEFDLYTNSIIIIKDLSTFTEQDFSLLFKENINITSLKYYVIKK